MLKFIASAAIVLAGLVPSAGFASPGAGLSASVPSSGIVQVYGGCGPYSHRGPYGGCRPGGQWGGYVPGYGCPPGWHVGPYGRRCWPN